MAGTSSFLGTLTIPNFEYREPHISTVVMPLPGCYTPDGNKPREVSIMLWWAAAIIVWLISFA